MDTLENKTRFRQPASAVPSDQLFLLNFIMSTCLGPDVYSDNPRCSSFERLAKRAPPYTSNNLGTSFLSVSQLESIYYYILRNAHPNLVLKPDMFYMYLKGRLHLPSSGLMEDNRQFPSFFPLSLHDHKKYSPNSEIVKGIVLIGDPITSYIKEKDLERFKYLSGIDNLGVDAKECLSYQHGHQKDREETMSTCTTDSEKKIARNNSNAKEKSSAMFGKKYKRRLRNVPKPIPEFPCKVNGSATKPVGTPPELEDCLAYNSIILTGTATKVMAGSQVHLIGMGISEDAYFFQVALPGIRRDFCEFSCEIKSNGEVHIQGTMSGGKTIRKRSRVFHMKFRQLLPAGPFAFSFNLPGPVDPRLFSPSFRNDGIFEGIVIKQK